jgi:hypothetical protein
VSDVDMNLVCEGKVCIVGIMFCAGFAQIARRAVKLERAIRSVLDVVCKVRVHMADFWLNLGKERIGEPFCTV